jgi:hypothetical protein
MNTLRNIAVTMTLAAVALSGAALAREPGDRGERNRDRVEQSDIDREARRAERRAERRASDDDVVVREDRRANRAERRARERREQRRHRVSYDRHDRYGRVDRRQDRQHARIVQGRHSGELTRGEARRLKKQQKKINRMERRFSRDGYLSARERYRLELAQDRASRRIARLKNNHVYRGSGHRYAYGRSSYKRRW